MEMGAGLVISLLGFVFVVSNGVFLFIWNNMTTANKTIKDDAAAALKESKDHYEKKLAEIWTAIDIKASAADMEARRQDVRELHGKIDHVKDELLNKLDAQTKDIMETIRQCHPTRKKRA